MYSLWPHDFGVDVFAWRREPPVLSLRRTVTELRRRRRTERRLASDPDADGRHAEATVDGVRRFQRDGLGRQLSSALWVTHSDEAEFGQTNEESHSRQRHRPAEHRRHLRPREHARRALLPRHEVPRRHHPRFGLTPRWREDGRQVVRVEWFRWLRVDARHGELPVQRVFWSVGAVGAPWRATSRS